MLQGAKRLETKPAEGTETAFQSLEAQMRAAIDAAVLNAAPLPETMVDLQAEAATVEWTAENQEHHFNSTQVVLKRRKTGGKASIVALVALAAGLLAAAAYSWRPEQMNGVLKAGNSPDPSIISIAAAANETTRELPAGFAEDQLRMSNAPTRFQASLVSPVKISSFETVENRTADTLAGVIVAENTPVQLGGATNLAPGTPAAGAVRGMTDREIRFGIAAPFSGPSRELGRQMKLGIESAFNQANEGGGVNGRQLKLFAADDGYEPSRTAEAMRELTDKGQVFGIIGNVGTPTAAVALPIALEQKMVFFGAFSGANLLRHDPPDRYAFNYRASYAEETAAVVRYLVKVRRLQPSEVAVFAQNDAFGDAGYAGVTKAFRSLPGDTAEPLRLNYNRNTVDVQAAITQMRGRKSQFKAVIMVATYRAAAKFIEKTRDDYPNMIYTNVSFVGSTSLVDELSLLGARFASGVIVTQVVPAVSSHSSLILKYKAALNKYFPGEAADYVSLEGYIDASLMIEAISRAGPQFDSEKFVETLESIRNFDMGLGTQLSFGIGEHQASHKVWGTQIDKTGHYQPIDLE